MEVSQRVHNNVYAPGIATYGIQGKTGNDGQPGTCMFFTDFDIKNNEDIKSFKDKITSRKLPLKNDNTVLNRNYINGDLFITDDGKIYMLIDINNLSLLNITADQTTYNWELYFKYVASFDKEQSIFTNNNLKTDKLVITDNTEINTDSDSLLTINRLNNINNSVSFINLNALYGNSANINLDIQYDNKLKAFVFKSQYPIVFDANTYVNHTTNVGVLNDYSPVQVKDNTITNFYGICSDITYNINASIYKYTKTDNTVYYGCLYIIKLNIPENNNTFNIYTLENPGINIHFQNGYFLDYQLYNNEQTYYFKQDYDYVKLNQLINTIQNKELSNILVSLIDNIEIYLKNNKVDNTIIGLI